MDAKNVPDNKLMWYVIIHLTFVLSAFVMGYLDRLNKVKHCLFSPGGVSRWAFFSPVSASLRWRMSGLLLCLKGA